MTAAAPAPPRVTPAEARASRVPAALLAILILIGLPALAWWTLHDGTPVQGRWSLLRRYGFDWAAFAVAVALVRRVRRRTAVALIVAGGLALQIVAVSFAPTTTDDFYRYVWDGKVQAHGIDPYRWTPLDPHLAGLRDPWLFPTDVPRNPAAAGNPLVTDLCTSAGVPHDCTRINRPNVHTIYPPVAEAWFLGLHFVSPQSHRQLAVQIAEALLAMATLILLLLVLHGSGRDPCLAALWAWCPLVWLECGNNAHVDVLGALLLVAALGVLEPAGSRGTATARRVALAGALLGAAVCVKLVPVLAGPAMLGRRARIFVAAGAATVVLVYLPHVLAVGSAVLGYLPGYLHEEGYGGAQRFGSLRLFLPAGLAPWVGGGLVVAVVALVWAGAARRPAAAGALIVTGTALALIGPSQPWYGILLVALVALTGRWEWLAVAAAAYPVYLAGALDVDNTHMQQRTYLPAVALVLAVALVRRNNGRRTGCASW